MHALSLITFLPVAGGLALLGLPNRNRVLPRVVAAIASGAALIVAVWLWAHFEGARPDLQFVEKFDWISTLHIRYFLALDGLSLPLVVLTAFLSFIAIIGSFRVENRVKEYFFFFLLLETAMIGAFCALDLFLFYVFWELTLVPMYFLIGIWGGQRRELASIKFFLFTLFGSVFMLVAILALYFAAQPHTFDFTELMAQNSHFARPFQLWVFLGFWLGFAVKIPAVPLHTWLPLAHVEAPTAISVILAGVLLKMGAYGIMRFSFGLLPTAARDLAFWIAVIGTVNVVYGALCSMAQKDLKRIIAYSSINHMGYTLLGMASLSAIGFNGAVLQMVSHGVITGALFLLVGVLYDRTHTRELDAFGGLGAQTPVYTGLTVVACFASLGLPLFAGFVGEFLCLLAAFQVPRYRILVGVSLLGLLFTATFFLNLIKRVFLGPLNPRWEKLRDIDRIEMIAIAPLVASMVALGIFPNIALTPISVALAHIAELLK
jgi:NADH-quinone oxidoreductase subunit M